MEKLFNYHYDFIKLKLYDVDISKINWNNLKWHPNLKNHYTLDSQNLFTDKNFDLFIDGGNNAIIRMSLPYLCYGHNYTTFLSKELYNTLNLLGSILGMYLLGGTVLQLEFGAYKKIAINPSDYIRKISGLLDYPIEKMERKMKMYGNGKGFHFKIYDPISNSKKKKTFSLSKYPNSLLIKYEAKFTDLKTSSGERMDAFNFCNLKAENRGKKIIQHHCENLIFIDELLHLPLKPTLNHVIYAALKNMEQQSGICAYKLTTSLIDEMRITPSQKSKRRKSVELLEKNYNKSTNK